MANEKQEAKPQAGPDGFGMLVYKYEVDDSLFALSLAETPGKRVLKNATHFWEGDEAAFRITFTKV